MTITEEILTDETRDAPADEAIQRALSLDAPKSFFLYAGAGSGKTRSLKSALEAILVQYGEEFRRRGRQVGVITYTNAARDEILRRVKHNAIFHVATIHSFAWSLIEGRNFDIRRWLSCRLPEEIMELEDKQARGRPSKAADERARKIESKNARLTALSGIKVFTYNPNGDNFDRDALSHDEVIEISSEFLTTKPTLQKIILTRYPFLLIDESQDTLRPFMDALLYFENEFKEQFSLGLFGDTMQRIYGHGKADLADSVPLHWDRPAKMMNHRSRNRIIRLANAIRADADGHKQLSRADRNGGYAFAYILPSSTTDRPVIECRIRIDVAHRTADKGWNDPHSIKTLTLEHHMSAARLGFDTVFNALDPVSTYRTSFRDGTLAPLRLYTDRVLPLVEAHREGDSYGVMAVLRDHSPHMSKSALRASGERATSRLEAVRDATTVLLKLFDDDPDPTCGAVLGVIADSGLFTIPEELTSFASKDSLSSLNEEYIATDEVSGAWRSFLRAPFSQISIYKDYVTDRSPYGTHQGVKGLEFPRVMVIADDTSMRFKGAASYEKLLGAKPPSDTDRKNAADGKETSLDRTRRLLYVTCTRAKDSLALVVYTDNPTLIAKELSARDWFTSDEIIMTI